MIGSVRRERGESAGNTEESDDNGERRETEYVHDSDGRLSSRRTIYGKCDLPLIYRGQE